MAALIVLQTAACAVCARAGEVVKIEIGDLAFVPADVTVHAGDTIEWVNKDFVDHTATARGGRWDILVAAGKTAQLDVGEPQTTDYFCRFHPNMVGKITVLGK